MNQQVQGKCKRKKKKMEAGKHMLSDLEPREYKHK